MTRHPARPHRRSTLVIGLVIGLCACETSEPQRWPPAAANLIPAAPGPLYVQFADFDQRISAISPRTGTVLSTLYPDTIVADVRFVRDFIVDARHIYLLLGSRHRPDPERLFAAKANGRDLRSVKIAPRARSLSWDMEGRILICHGADDARGHRGRGALSVVTVAPLRVKATIPLPAGCAAVEATGAERAMVLERDQLIGDGDTTIALSSLTAVDLKRGRTIYRTAIPSGAGTMRRGPTGLLYISQASGAGTMETDGTITVFDVKKKRVVDRLRLRMVIRSMLNTGRRLVLNALSSSGESWFSVIDAAHQTDLDFRFDSLVGEELAMVGDRIFVPMRRKSELATFELKTRGLGPRLHLARKARGYDDRPTRLRTPMELTRAP